jgi:hypothetical protein
MLKDLCHTTVLNVHEATAVNLTPINFRTQKTPIFFILVFNLTMTPQTVMLGVLMLIIRRQQSLRFQPRLGPQSDQQLAP